MDTYPFEIYVFVFESYLELDAWELIFLLFASQTKGWEEGGDDVKSAWPFDALGDTRATMAGTEGCETARWSQSQKTGLSSDWSLQLDSMKLESLVIGDQPRPGEYVLGSCTHQITAPGSILFPSG